MNIPQAIVDKLAEQVADKIIDRAHSDWHEFCDEGYISIDLDAEIWRVVSATGRYHRLQELLFEELVEHQRLSMIENEIREIVSELADEAYEWEQANRSVYGLLRYHGMSVNDFIYGRYSD